MKDMTPQIYGTEHYLHKTVDIEHQKHLFSLNVTMNRRICSLVYRLERSEKQEMFQIQFDNETEFSFFDSVSYIKT